MQIKDEMKEWLKTAGYALVPVKLSLGDGEEVLFIVKSTRDVLAEIKAARVEARMGWAVGNTPSGPVLCALFDAEQGGKARLTLECYFDPFDEADVETLREVAAQENLRAALFDEETDVVGLVGVRWDEIARLALEQAMDRAEELAERALQDCVEPDFEMACEFFRNETTIEKLAEKVF